MPHSLPPAPTHLSDRLVMDMDIASRSTSVTGHAAWPRRNRVTPINPIRNKFLSMSSRLRTNRRAETRVVVSRLEYKLHPTGTTGGQIAYLDIRNLR